MKKIKLVTMGFVLGILLTIATKSFATAYLKSIDAYFGDIYINVNGKNVSSGNVGDAEPFIYNSRVYAPLRLVSEAIGADVNWNSQLRTVEITKSAAIEPYFQKINGYSMLINQLEYFNDTTLSFDDVRYDLPSGYIGKVTGHSCKTPFGNKFNIYDPTTLGPYGLEFSAFGHYLDNSISNEGWNDLRDIIQSKFGEDKAIDDAIKYAREGKYVGNGILEYTSSEYKMKTGKYIRVVSNSWSVIIDITAETQPPINLPGRY